MANVQRLLSIALVLSLGLAARGQESPANGAGEGISVGGTGEVKSKPNAVEISATVSGDAELAADAIVKYRDARRRGVEALTGLKLEGLKVESGGFSINAGMDPAIAQAMMQGNVPSNTKQRVTVTENLKLVLSGLEKLKDEELMDAVLKVLDTGRDAGLQIGRPQPRNYWEAQMMYNNGNQAGPLVSFKLKQPEALREKAYKDAMSDARTKAERLATLAGVKLGRIVSVKDAVAINSGNPQQSAMMAMYGIAAPPPNEELTSAMFTEISVKVSLAVQFEIAK